MQKTPHPLRHTPTKESGLQLEEWTRIVWSDLDDSLRDGQGIHKDLHPLLTLWPRDHLPPSLSFSPVKDPSFGP